MENIQIVSLRMVKDSELASQYNCITHPSAMVNIFRQFIGDFDREAFIMATLSSKNYINALHVVSIGSLNASIVHPREVFKIAILSNAASIVIGHNHPSGSIVPSIEDFNVTSKLVEAGRLLDIPVLDHIIIGDKDYYSFKDRGRL